MKYERVIFTNPETLKYFKPEGLNLSINEHELLTLIALSPKSFIEVGYYKEVPILVKKMWHDDDHFIDICTGELIGDQFIEDYSMDRNWDDYLVLH